MFTDRYQALGIPYPDLSTVCRGECEGTGWVPVCHPDHAVGIRPADSFTDRRLIDLWYDAHRKAHRQSNRIIYLWKAIRHFDLVWLSLAVGSLACDGWHFVKCPDCAGKGKRLTN